MRLRHWISILLCLGFIIGTGYGESPQKAIKLDAVWMTLDNQEVNLSGLLKKQKTLFILYFGAGDCGTCVRKGIRQIKEISPNALYMVGYGEESEASFVAQHYDGFLILRDNKRALFERMQLNLLTPIILKINKNLEIQEYIPVDLSNPPE